MEHDPIFFINSKGLRHDDLLSLYLFILVMEALNQLLWGILSGPKMERGRREGKELSHLLFVDDTLIFRETSYDQMRYLKWVSKWFKALKLFQV